jgi:pyruvate kinase
MAGVGILRAMTNQLNVDRVRLIERRTKIVATVGPASSSPEVLGRLIEAGVDTFRQNFSHGTHEEHAALYATIRAAAETAGKHVAILADLCGPKIRCGRFRDGGIDLVAGESVVVTVRKVEGEPGLIPSEYEALASDVEPGDPILMDDGQRELKVTSVTGSEIACEVIRGGRLTDRKGINLPGVKISAPSLTDKDKADAAFAAQLGVDFVALSFVRRPEDVTDLRALLAQHSDLELPIVSKIEKPEALECIDEILAVTDGIMVARGDLGVEMPAEQVPLIQRELTRRAIEANRLVIVATQMLDSMIQNARPTRAEVTDVAWAAMAGADAVMLSGETAVGAHPREAVATMDRVLRLVEGSQWGEDQFDHLVEHESLASSEETAQLQLAEALARGASQLSRELQVRALVIRSHTGHTARMVSSERPSAPIVSLSTSPRTCRRLALAWGVLPRHATDDQLADVLTVAPELVRDLKLAEAGQFVLLVTGGSTERERLAPGIRILMT